jgi:imidazolonepropionase-like amidohydrolase
MPMRSLAIALPCLALLMGAACAPVPPPSDRSPASSGMEAAGALVIAGVSIIDVENNAASSPHDILIQDGRIVAIVPAGRLRGAEGIRRLDATGRFALAGLIDVHAHVGEGGIAPGDDATRARALRQFLRYGVTTIFVPGATGAGDADFPALRERCRAVPAGCPGLYGSGSLITAPGSHPVSTIFNMPADTPPEVTEARGVTVLRPGMDVDALVAAKQAAGVDAIKIVIEDGPPPWYPKPRLGDDQIRALVAAAHARDLPVFAHISTAEHVRIALDAGVDGIMHGPTDRLPDELVRRMAEQRMTFVATFALYDGILTWARGRRESDPYALAGVEPSAIESLTAPPFLAAAAEDEAGALGYLANASDNLRRAAAAGVPIALGTDVNNPFVFPGYSAHEELSLMVRAGLTPAEALRAGTVGGAAFLRRPEQVGRIAPGYEADFVLLARNPLERIENSRSIIAVFADGERVAGVVSAE